MLSKVETNGKYDASGHMNPQEISAGAVCEAACFYIPRHPQEGPGSKVVNEFPTEMFIIFVHLCQLSIMSRHSWTLFDQTRYNRGRGTGAVLALARPMIGNRA